MKPLTNTVASHKFLIKTACFFFFCLVLFNTNCLSIIKHNCGNTASSPRGIEMYMLNSVVLICSDRYRDSSQNTYQYNVFPMLFNEAVINIIVMTVLTITKSNNINYYYGHYYRSAALIIIIN